MVASSRVWTCVACGRRVPQELATCRCGWPRETPAPGRGARGPVPRASNLLGAWAPVLGLAVASLWAAWWFVRTPVGTVGAAAESNQAVGLFGPGPDRRPPLQPRSYATPYPLPSGTAAPAVAPPPVVAQARPPFGWAAGQRGNGVDVAGEGGTGRASSARSASSAPERRAEPEPVSEMDRRRERGAAQVRSAYAQARGLAAELDGRLREYHDTCPRNAVSVPDCERRLEGLGRVVIRLAGLLEGADETARAAGLLPGTVRDLREEAGLDDGGCERLMATVRALR